MDLFLFLGLLSIPLLFLFWISYFQIWTAGWTPTWKKDANKIIEALEIKEGDKLFDLGCGDGRFLLLGAKEGAKTIGIEMDPIRYLIAKIRALLSKEREKIEVRFGDFFKTNISDADIIILYLSDKANEKLKPKLMDELKKETKIISYTYKINGWKPIKVIEGKREIYLYRYPESVKKNKE